MFKMKYQGDVLKSSLYGRLPYTDKSQLDKSQLIELIDRMTSVQVTLSERISALESENRHLHSIALTDDLTGLYNKRFFNRQLTVEMERTKRTGLTCVLMMIDIDNFKLLNDSMGHDAGDLFLVRLGHSFRSHIRPTDYACRFGGDEFAAIMPVTEMKKGLILARRIAAAVVKAAPPLPEELGCQITLSIGIAAYDAFSLLSTHDFFRQVDGALYQAKNNGKGQIVCADAKSGKKHSDMTFVTSEEKAALFISPI